MSSQQVYNIFHLIRMLSYPDVCLCVCVCERERGGLVRFLAIKNYLIKSRDDDDDGGPVAVPLQVGGVCVDGLDVPGNSAASFCAATLPYPPAGGSVCTRNRLHLVLQKQTLWEDEISSLS